jgi:NAD(P)-dependent dehydrogenase (short-subunit alcohol dehydrogenase family)
LKMGLPDFSLIGRVALVTGARRGIGKTIALALAEAGADVGLCDLVLEDGQLQAVAQEILALGRRSLFARADTRRKSDVDGLVERVIGELGRIDILVNNAGIAINSPILDMAEEDWDRILDIDLKGYFLCSQAAGRKMVQQKAGTIINLASQFAFRVTPGMGAYSIAKAGVVMLTRTLAQELGKFGIRANAIAPGMVKTEINQASRSNPEELKRIESAIPLGRIAETDDLVGAALFLASDASRYITGQTLLVDGGRSA